MAICAHADDIELNAGVTLAKYRHAGYEGMLLFWYNITAPPAAATQRTWDSFVNVTGYWQAKLEAIALHACQIVDVHALDLPKFGSACACGDAEVFRIAERGVPPDYPYPFSLEIFLSPELILRPKPIQMEEPVRSSKPWQAMTKTETPYPDQPLA